MAATKTVAEEQAWVAITAANDANAGPVDFSTDFKGGIIVTVCPIEAVAHANGVLVIVEAEFDDANNYYRRLYELRMGAGTASLEAIGTEADPTDQILLVGSTTDFETLGDRYVIHNTVDVEKSELVTNSGFVNDTSIAIVESLINTQQTSANLYNIVAEKYFPIPDEVSTVRVLFINDDADCDVIVRVDAARMTAIS